MLIRYTDKIYTQYRSVLKDLPTANDAPSYCFIYLVIFQALLDKRVVLKYATLRQEASPSNEESQRPDIPAQPSSASPVLEPTLRPIQMSLYVETELKQHIKYNRKDYVLSGFANYTLGYCNEGTLSGNLILVEAKRRYQMAEAYGQLLSYRSLPSSLGLSVTG